MGTICSAFSESRACAFVESPFKARESDNFSFTEYLVLVSGKHTQVARNGIRPWPFGAVSAETLGVDPYSFAHAADGSYRGYLDLTHHRACTWDLMLNGPFYTEQVLQVNRYTGEWIVNSFYASQAWQFPGDPNYWDLVSRTFSITTNTDSTFVAVTTTTWRHIGTGTISVETDTFTYTNGVTLTDTINEAETLQLSQAWDTWGYIDGTGTAVVAAQENGGVNGYGFSANGAFYYDLISDLVVCESAKYWVHRALWYEARQLYWETKPPELMGAEIPYSIGTAEYTQIDPLYATAPIDSAHANHIHTYALGERYYRSVYPGIAPAPIDRDVTPIDLNNMPIDAS